MKKYDFKKEAKHVLEICALRMKVGESEYREFDFTKKFSCLMGRNFIQEVLEEVYDIINYFIGFAVYLQHLLEKIEADPIIQRVNPSGKPKKKHVPT